MKAARPLSLLLATSLFATAASAQQTESARLNAPLPPATRTNAVAPSESLTSLPTGNAFLHAAAPQKPEEHKFFDKEQLIGLCVHAGVRTADTIVTFHNISNGATERWIPTQSYAGIAAWQSGSVGLALGVGYLFHKTGHHKLERITPWVATGASGAGLTKSVFNIR